MKEIVVVGTGYVGLAYAVLLAQKNRVTAEDIDEERVQKINRGEPALKDERIGQFMKEQKLDLMATSDAGDARKTADYIFVAVPTDFDSEKNRFDCSAIETVLDKIRSSGSRAVIVMKSTVPIGYTRSLREKYPSLKLLFSPEFLREGKALEDVRKPSRIIVGCDESCRKEAQEYVSVLSEVTEEKVPVKIMGYAEAEAVKLFSNTYLAMRVAFFNELDLFAESRGYCSRDMIEGVCLDPRIGDYYNNPSFGYGGYCLPKDSKQLRAGYGDIPQKLIGAVVDSNEIRKDFAVEKISERARRAGGDSTIGIFRLSMKADSDDFRQASILDIIRRLKDKNRKLVIYEPGIPGDFFEEIPVIREMEEFKRISDVIVANRMEGMLDDVRDKVYTRDQFQRD